MIKLTMKNNIIQFPHSILNNFKKKAIFKVNRLRIHGRILKKIININNNSEIMYLKYKKS